MQLTTTRTLKEWRVQFMTVGEDTDTVLKHMTTRYDTDSCMYVLNRIITRTERANK